MLSREQTVWLVITILFFLIFIFLYTRQPTVYYAAPPWEAPKPPAPMPAPGQALPLASNPSLAFSDTNLFGQPSQPFVLKQNQIKPSTEPAPDSLRYTNISGLKPMTSITGAGGSTSTDSSPLFSGPAPNASRAKLKAEKSRLNAAVAKLDPIAGAALLNGLINPPGAAPVISAATRPASAPPVHTPPARTPAQAASAATSVASVPVPPAPTADHLAVAPVEAPADTPVAQTVPIPPVSPVVKTGSSAKKGFVAGNSDPSAAAKIASLNVGWYYTWGSTPPSPAPSGLLFSPMFWNISKAPKAPAGCAPSATPPATANALCTLQTIKGLSASTTDNVILAYNEPDGLNANAQGNMTTTDSANFWPNIVASATRSGCRIGSPVMYGSLVHPASGSSAQNVVPIAGVTAPQTVNISNNPASVNHVVLDPGIWLDNFLLRISQTPNPRFPDFITIHWYGPPNPTSFLNYLTAVNTKYNLPLWITEYSCADWSATTSGAGVTTHAPGYDWSIPTDANIATNSTGAFMKATVQGMEAMPFVERFSWKERFLLSDPSLNYPNSMFPLTGTPDSVMGPSNPDVMNQSTLFASYQHFPTSLPPLTPLGKLYASL